MTDDNIRYLAGSKLPDRATRAWLTSAELVAEGGITYKQLDYWTRTDLLHPIEANNPGSGHLRRYDEHQLRRVLALRDLLYAGVSLQTCRQVLDDVIATGHATVGAVTITIPRHPSGDVA